MITYNSTYVKKLSKDVSEVEKVFYEIPAAFTKDGKLYMHNNESSSYYTDGLNQPYTAKEFIRDSILENNRTSSAKQTSDFNLQKGTHHNLVGFILSFFKSCLCQNF